MNSFNIALVIGFFVFVAALFLLLAISKRRLNLGQRLGEPESARKKTGPTFMQRLERVLIPIGEMLPRSANEMSRQERRLVQAGIRRKDAVLLLNAAHLTIAMLLLLLFASTGYLYQRPAFYALLSILGGAAIPDLWLKNKGDRRKENIQCALPDAMDLAVISVEAGLGLDQALLRVGTEIRGPYPELSEEFHLRNMEVNMGRSRGDSLRNMADRTGVDDLKALVAILIQTDRFGTSVGQALRTFSDSLRTKRKQRAEEKAAKLAIKMIVPMVLFIFPGIFVVILGPAVLAIIRDLIPRLGGH